MAKLHNFAIRKGKNPAKKCSGEDFCLCPTRVLSYFSFLHIYALHTVAHSCEYLVWYGAYGVAQLGDG